MLLIRCEFLACSLKDERMVEDHGHRKPGKLNECHTQTTGTNENSNELYVLFVLMKYYYYMILDQLNFECIREGFG